MNLSSALVGTLAFLEGADFSVAADCLPLPFMPPEFVFCIPGLVF